MANLTRYQPQSPLALRDAIDRLFEDSWIFPRGMQQGGFGQLAGNLYEGEDTLVVQLAVPGIAPESCDITVRENVLNVRGERHVEAPEGMQPIWQGFGGTFEQSFTLPWPVDSEHVDASYENGILTLRLPKAEHARAKRIQIKSGK